MIQTIKDLNKRLEEQIKLLKNNIRAYDAGFDEASIQISTICRVLVHDTNKSKSLLTLLNKKNTIKYITGVNGYVPANLLPYSKNIGVKSSIINNNYELKFYSTTPKKNELFNVIFADFDIWWNEIILSDINKNLYTRKEIILFVANKYGGAHIDSNIPDYFYNLENNNTMGWTVQKDGQTFSAINSPLLGLVKTIGFDLLLSLRYTLYKVNKFDNIIIKICNICGKKYFYLLMEKDIKEKEKEEAFKSKVYIANYNRTIIYTTDVKTKNIFYKQLYLLKNI